MIAVDGPTATVPARTVQEYVMYGLKPEKVMDCKMRRCCGFDLQ